MLARVAEVQRPCLRFHTVTQCSCNQNRCFSEITVHFEQWNYSSPILAELFLIIVFWTWLLLAQFKLLLTWLTGDKIHPLHETRVNSFCASNNTGLKQGTIYSCRYAFWGNCCSCLGTGWQPPACPLNLYNQKGLSLPPSALTYSKWIYSPATWWAKISLHDCTARVTNVPLRGKDSVNLLLPLCNWVNFTFHSSWMLFIIFHDISLKKMCFNGWG